MARFMLGTASRLVVATVVAVLVAGCATGSSASPASPSSASAAPTSASATASAVTSPSASPGPITAAIQSAGVIRVGVAQDDLPWLGYDSKTKTWFGAGQDVAVALAEALGGVKIEYVQTTFGTFVAGLQANQFDIFVPSAGLTEKRLAVVNMTAYSNAGTCYLVKKSNTKINTLADLNSPDVTFAQFSGMATTDLVKAKYPLSKTIVRTQASGENADTLSIEAGRADAAPFDNPFATVFLEKFPDLKVLPTDCLTNSDLSVPIGVGYNKGDDGFQALVGATIAKIQPQIDADIAKYSASQYLTAVP